MKKFVTMLVLCVVMLVYAFGFTACLGTNDGKGTEKQIGQEQSNDNEENDNKINDEKEKDFGNVNENKNGEQNDDVSDTSEDLEEPIDPKDFYTREGNFIYFGSYPQKDVTSEKGSELSAYVKTKPTSGNNNGWTSYKYYIECSNSTNFMWFKDIDLDSDGTNDYRAVFFNSYRPMSTRGGTSAEDSYQDDSKYYKNNIYWFKYEPIKWRVLDEKNGKAILFAEFILDSQEYYYTNWKRVSSTGYIQESRTINGQVINDNNYQYSSIRAWLNDNFYNTAFSRFEKSLIDLVTVDNSARSTNPYNSAKGWNNGTNNNACKNTIDKVWLLSQQEITKDGYGFLSANKDKARQKKTTAYARCQGVCDPSYNGNYIIGVDGDGLWWLRSPYFGNTKDYAQYVYIDGSYGVNSDCRNLWVARTDVGVVPAVKISIS